MKDRVSFEHDCAAECTSLSLCIGYAYRIFDGNPNDGRCYLYGPELDEGLSPVVSGVLNDWRGFSQPNFVIEGSAIDCATLGDGSECTLWILTIGSSDGSSGSSAVTCRVKGELTNEPIE